MDSVFQGLEMSEFISHYQDFRDLKDIKGLAIFLAPIHESDVDYFIRTHPSHSEPKKLELRKEWEGMNIAWKFTYNPATWVPKEGKYLRDLFEEDHSPIENKKNWEVACTYWSGRFESTNAAVPGSEYGAYPVGEYADQSSQASGRPRRKIPPTYAQIADMVILKEPNESDEDYKVRSEKIRSDLKVERVFYEKELMTDSQASQEKEGSAQAPKSAGGNGNPPATGQPSGAQFEKEADDESSFSKRWEIFLEREKVLESEFEKLNLGADLLEEIKELWVMGTLKDKTEFPRKGADVLDVMYDAAKVIFDEYLARGPNADETEVIDKKFQDAGLFYEESTKSIQNFSDFKDSEEKKNDLKKRLFNRRKAWVQSEMRKRFPEDYSKGTPGSSKDNPLPVPEETFTSKLRLERNVVVTKLMEKKIPDGLANIFALNVPAKPNYGVSGFKLKKGEITPSYVTRFCIDNGINVDIGRDFCFAVIILVYVNHGILEENMDADEEYAQVEAKNIPKYITEKRISDHLGVAKAMMIVSLHAYCQGHIYEEVPWYASYCNAYGDYLTMKKFGLVIKLLVESPLFAEIPKMITLNELQSENNVLKYRLTRFSTPGLIRIATKLLPYRNILSKFDADILLSYRRYDEGGILAQVASGPLSQFCKGNINPLTVKEYPAEATIADLEAIPPPPIDYPTIAKSRIILEEAGVGFGKWYQGITAMKSQNLATVLFRAEVQGIMKAVAARAAEIGLEKQTLFEEDRGEEAEEFMRSLGVIKGWGSVN